MRRPRRSSKNDEGTTNGTLWRPVMFYCFRFETLEGSTIPCFLVLFWKIIETKSRNPTELRSFGMCSYWRRQTSLLQIEETAQTFCFFWNLPEFRGRSKKHFLESLGILVSASWSDIFRSSGDEYVLPWREKTRLRPRDKAAVQKTESGH